MRHKANCVITLRYAFPQGYSTVGHSPLYINWPFIFHHVLVTYLVVMPSVDTFENVMKLSAMIVQCLWENQSPLLQLPHLLPEQLKHFHTKKRNINSIEGFAALPKKQRRYFH